MKKTFFNLIQEVQKEGKCSHCGGCVTFCSAINYGALELDDEGMPVFADIEKCNECGLCYAICPQTHELDLDIREKAGWKRPFGSVISTGIARARDEELVKKATDGGVVTALLTRMLAAGKINGAIVSKSTPHGRVPCLARTPEDLMASAGSHFGSSQGMVEFAADYATFSPSIKALAELKETSMNRLAFVGVPCQINTMRKMQAMGILPSDAISCYLGLFCSGNYHFGTNLFARLEDKYQFSYKDVSKINVKDDFIFSLKSGRQVLIPIRELGQVRREACNFCEDFAAEYADISFGGLGAEQGWTTAIIRTDAGRQIYEDGLATVLEAFPFEENKPHITQAEGKILAACEQKKKMCEANLNDREKGVCLAV